jgi:Concanavalin A-like lectin/glucanases superfamily
MATQRGPKIVRDGLILCLDAADRKSYPGSGNIWYDLTQNKNHFTLTNIAFNAGNGGNIFWDGAGGRYASSVSTVNLSAYDQITAEVWFKQSDTSSRAIFEHSTNAWAGGNEGGFSLYSNDTGGGNDSNACTTWSPSLGRTYSFNCGTTQYSCHVNIYSKIADSTGRLVYVNGNLLPFSSAGGNSTSTATTATYAFRNDTMYLGSRGGGSFYFYGSMAIFKIYNRKLSASEISQNFNALRGRFGI